MSGGGGGSGGRRFQGPFVELYCVFFFGLTDRKKEAKRERERDCEVGVCICGVAVQDCKGLMWRVLMGWS